MTRDGFVVADTGPLIHPPEASALDTLEQFTPVLVPETVFAELRRGGVPASFESLDTERRSVDLSNDPWPDLDPGETAALTLAESLGGMLLTDDLDARQQADELGIEVHGSIGVVLAAYASGRVDGDEAKQRIRALEHDSTLYLSEPLVSRALARIDDENL